MNIINPQFLIKTGLALPTTKEKIHMNKDKDYALPKAVSIKKELYDEAMKKADSLGLSFSQLVTTLLRKEMENKGDFTIKHQKTEKKDGFSDW